MANKNQIAHSSRAVKKDNLHSNAQKAVHKMNASVEYSVPRKKVKQRY